MHAFQTNFAALGLPALWASLCVGAICGVGPTPSPQQAEPAAGTAQQATATQNEPAPRGKKLVLKDGSFQLVREYRVEGDRVRYFSLDSMQWEQLPGALVDWDATHKAEEAQAQADQSLVEKVHREEEARKAEPISVDASIEVAPGVFLPPGEGAFVVEGRDVFPLQQAEAGAKLSKGRFLEQVLVPIPIVPSRRVVSLKGTKAGFRVTTSEPEFYVRTADYRQPQMELIRARVRGNTRQIENIDTLFRREAEARNTLPLQFWEIAKGIYRFTLSAPLQPGEYALAEIVPGQGMNLYVWDFGVDATNGFPTK